LHHFIMCKIRQGQSHLQVRVRLCATFKDGLCALALSGMHLKVYQGYPFSYFEGTKA